MIQAADIARRSGVGKPALLGLYKPGNSPGFHTLESSSQVDFRYQMTDTQNKATMVDVVELDRQNSLSGEDYGNPHDLEQEDTLWEAHPLVSETEIANESGMSHVIDERAQPHSRTDPNIPSTPETSLPSMLARPLFNNSQGDHFSGRNGCNMPVVYIALDYIAPTQDPGQEPPVVEIVIDDSGEAILTETCAGTG